MTNNIYPSDDRERHVDALIAAHLEAERTGLAPDREQLLKEHPDLAGELGSFFADRDQFEKRAGPLRADETDVAAAARNAALMPTLAPGDAPSPTPGDMLRYFGDYELLEEIARGGMGVVYKARQTTLDRIVAVKMILAGNLASQADIERFHVEAQAAANLRHPNIVAIHEVGKHAGQHYFSMDYVEGQSLADMVRESPLSGERAAAYVKTIAEAIEYAHQQGTLHRDLKPSNVLIDDTDQPRVTDFGLAKRIEGDSALTGTGQILGTPSYMPPEQAAANRGEVGPPSDVYSLGAVLYELLTGRPPFKAETPLDTLMQVLEVEPVSPRLLNPKIHKDLETIALKCLQKSPKSRYATAAELAADLRRFLHDEPILARPVSGTERLWRWCRRNPRVAALTGAVFVLLATVAAGSSVAAVRIAREKQRTEQARQTADENYRHAQTQRERAEASQREALANLKTADTERRRAEANYGKARGAVDQMLTRVGQERLSGVPQMEPVRRALLEDALRFYEGFLEEKSDDPTVRTETARAYCRVADICGTLGKLDEAHDAYLHGEQLFAGLADEYAAEPKYRNDLALVKNQLGKLLSDTGRAPEAKQAFDQAIAILEPLAAEFPAIAEYRAALVDTLCNLGTLDELNDRFGDAEAAYRRAVKLADDLTARFPGTSDYEFNVSQCCGGLARLLRASNREVEAEQIFRRGLDGLEKLAATFPAVIGYKNALAKFHHNHGIQLDMAGRADEAERSFRRAVELHDKLAGDFPHVVEYRQDLAKHHNSLGMVLSSLRRPQEAEGAFVRAIAIKQKLAADLPTVTMQRMELANSYNGLGMFRMTFGETEKAVEAYRQAIAVLDELVAEYPGSGDYRSRLGGVLNNLAMVTSDQRQARGHVERAIEQQRLAIEINPENAMFHQFLRNHYSTLATILLQLEEHVDAAQVAAELAGASPHRAAESYNAACFLARCIPLANGDAALPGPARQAAADDYARRAIAQLKVAVASGFNDLNHIDKDPDLEALRDRDDFRQLLEKLKSASPSGQE